MRHCEVKLPCSPAELQSGTVADFTGAGNPHHVIRKLQQPSGSKYCDYGHSNTYPIDHSFKSERMIGGTYR